MVALDLVPPSVEARTGAVRDRAISSRASIADARRDDLVVVDGPAPAWSPFAAFVPYGMRVAHRSTRARVDEATDAEIAVVAVGLRDALAALQGRAR